MKRDAKKEQIVQEIACIVAKVLVKRDVINPSIAHYISVLIENLVVKSDKIDIAEVFALVCKALIPNISDEDIQASMKVIEYLLQIKAIKKIPVLK